MIRDALNQHPAAARIAAVCLFLFAGAALAYQAYSSASAQRGPQTQAFYSTDDGATFFRDDVDKLSGFDHNGKPAYRAHVYQANGGEPFVGYLERFTPEALAKIGQLPNKGQGADPMAMRSIIMTGQEVKKPGDAKWYKRGEEAAQKVLDIRAPDGSKESLEPVLP